PQYHPAEYAEIVREWNAQRAADEDAALNGLPLSRPLAEYLGEEGVAASKRALKEKTDPMQLADEFTLACLECYRSLCDPKKFEAELAELKDKHDRLVKRLLRDDLPTQRAKDTAAAGLPARDPPTTEL